MSYTVVIVQRAPQIFDGRECRLFLFGNASKKPAAKPAAELAARGF